MDLGGGNHSFLGLVTKDEECAITSRTLPFAELVCPSDLTTLETEVLTEVLLIKNPHNEIKRPRL